MQLETQLAPSLHWDLSNVYAGLSSDDYAESVAKLTLLIDDLDSYIEEQHIAASGELPENSSTLNASPLASSALASSALATIINGYKDTITFPTSPSTTSLTPSDSSLAWGSSRYIKRGTRAS
jgi:hypothetical protein